MTVVTLNELTLDNSVRTAEHFYLLHQETDTTDDVHVGLLLDPPYQRSSIWEYQQRALLMRSLLCRLPVPGVVINDRSSVDFEPDYEDDRHDERYAVVDGKQRIETLIAWASGNLHLPADWFEDEYLTDRIYHADGRYTVTLSELTEPGRRLVGNQLRLPVATASVPTVAEEAAIYLLLNSGGTHHTADDLVVAQQMASHLV